MMADPNFLSSLKKMDVDSITTKQVALNPPPFIHYYSLLCNCCDITKMRSIYVSGFHSFILSFIHSFIHSEDLYSALIDALFEAIENSFQVLLKGVCSSSSSLNLLHLISLTQKPSLGQ